MAPTTNPLLEVRALRKVYTQGRWWQKQDKVCALDNVSLTIGRNQTTALIGESGSGKTTLAMCLVGLERADSGSICLEGVDLAANPQCDHRDRRGSVQMVFQDSAGALNPRLTAAQIIEEPLLIAREGTNAERTRRALDMMMQVGLSPKWGDRLPRTFSGGQRQRLAIARALVTHPKLLILDEALAGLDLSIQAQIANLLLDVQTSTGISYLYISHGVSLAVELADDVAVMCAGTIVEQASRAELFSNPTHSYTQSLLAALPVVKQNRAASGA